MFDFDEIFRRLNEMLLSFQQMIEEIAEEEGVTMQQLGQIAMRASQIEDDGLQ